MRVSNRRALSRSLACRLLRDWHHPANFVDATALCKSAERLSASRLKYRARAPRIRNAFGLINEVFRNIAGVSTLQSDRRSKRDPAVWRLNPASRKLMFPESGFGQTQRRWQWITLSTPSVGRFSRRRIMHRYLHTVDGDGYFDPETVITLGAAFDEA